MKSAKLPKADGNKLPPPRTDETGAVHSRIGASSMSRWSKCPGSVRLCHGLENVSSKYAEEGTYAHTCASTFLETGKWPPKMDPEMRDAVKVYTDFVLADGRDPDFPAKEFLIEHKFDLSAIHPGLFGTADCVVYHEDAKLLRVYDYKHGQGIPVEVMTLSDGTPVGNPQLLYYGLGALLSTGYPCDNVELFIIQPRCFHKDGPIRRYLFPAIELLDFASDLKKYAEATEDAFAKIVPGDHCRFCNAAAICPALRDKAQVLAKSEFTEIVDGTLKIPQNLYANYDPAKLSELLDWLPVLENWTSSVREFAYNEVNRGKQIPGWKMVAKKATRKWTNETDVAQFIEREFTTGRELYDPPSLKSVAQVEKILHKDQFPKLKPFISQISSGNSLVPDSDPRAEVKILDAKTEFELLDIFN